MRGLSKSTSLGTINGIALAPREMYPRELAADILPAGWTRCRIGMFFSLIGLDLGDNAAPPTSDTVPYLTTKDRLIFGVGNGVGTLGDPGNRFVGLASQASLLILGYMGGSTPSWYPTQSTPALVIGDGATIVATAFSDAYPCTAKHQTPAGADNFAGFWALDISLASTGVTMTTYVDTGTPIGITDVGAAALLRRMIIANVTRSATCTGGWWSGTPIGLQHVMIRLPYYNTRLRIHRLRVLNLS